MDPADRSSRGEDEVPVQQENTVIRNGVLPARLGRYRVVRKIGAGGMGEIFLAEDELLGRQVAIKVIGSPSLDAEVMERFRREARAIAALNHPNIVTIHDFGDEQGRHYFVTEYVSGATVREVIRRGDCPPRRSLEIGLGIASALAAVHEHGIVHRDVKPNNVLVDDRGNVKVIDFGIAKLRGASAPAPDDEPATPTRAGMVIGTIEYMAPEQLRAEPIDTSADVFALGVVLYELLAGRHPFAGATPQETMASVLLGEPRPLHDAARDPELGRLITAMLSKTRESRPAAADVVRELGRLLEEPAVKLERAVTNTGVSETPHNLPSDAAPLVGREEELSTVARLLQRSDVRLLTLTGAAGTGKTRLALAAARALLAEFPGGVWLVSLESIREPALVPSTIADAIGVSEASLRQRLRPERALLILDNFEQVLDAAPEVARLIAGTEALKVLVTSQAPLHLRAEHEYQLDPLPLPSGRASFEAIRDNPSVRMFVDRATSVRHDFAMTAQNASVIAEICRILGGLPLAIELAAARVRMLAPGAILEGLRDPLAFLTGGPRDMPERQRALRSAIEWTIGLLEERERRFFASLAAFEGGWTLQSCTEVLGQDAPERLASLADKSLVRGQPGAAEERFAMLDAIRKLAESQLAEGGEREHLADRHLAHFARLAESAAPHLVGREQPFWVARLAAEHANLRSALGHAVATGQAGIGLRLAVGVWKFWEVRGWYGEGRAWIERLLAISDGLEPALRWQAWYARGVLADGQGDYETAYASFLEQLAICRESGDRWSVASAINNVAIAALRLGKIDDAAAHHAEALSTWRELGHTPAIALSVQNLGHVERARGAGEAARDRYEESAALFRTLGDERGRAISLTCLADIDRDQDRFAEAVARYEEALEIFIGLTDHWHVARCMADCADAYRRLNDLAEAESLLAESVLIFREVGDPNRGADVLERLALVALDRGDPERALQLGGAAASVKKSLGLLSTALEENATMRQARAAAGERAEEAWRIGLAMNFDEAVEFAQSS